jgi:hypothetical protein
MNSFFDEALQRTVALAWLFHLVGDMRLSPARDRQPLPFLVN